MPSLALSFSRCSSLMTSNTTLTFFTSGTRLTPRVMSSLIFSFIGQPGTVRRIVTVTASPSMSTDLTISSSVSGFLNSGSSIPLSTCITASLLIITTSLPVIEVNIGQPCICEHLTHGFQGPVIDALEFARWSLHAIHFAQLTFEQVQLALDGFNNFQQR